MPDITTFSVRERASGKYTATLKDEADVAISSASLTTLTLTLTDIATNTVINSRDAQNVLNANNVTVDVNGLLTWTVQPADNAIVSTLQRKLERHRAVFRYTWASGAKADWHAFELLVEEEPRVSA